MSDNPDTIDIIVDDMLNEGHTGPADSLEWIQAKMKFYADRIKAAWKRQCSQSWHHREMEELILRHEKEVNELQRQQIDNAAATREALANLVDVIDRWDIASPLWWHCGAKGVKPLKDAKAALAAHSVPDWVAHRLATFKAEARGLDAALAEHQQEHKENQQ